VPRKKRLEHLPQAVPYQVPAGRESKLSDQTLLALFLDSSLALLKARRYPVHTVVAADIEPPPPPPPEPTPPPIPPATAAGGKAVPARPGSTKPKLKAPTFKPGPTKPKPKGATVKQQPQQQQQEEGGHEGQGPAWEPTHESAAERDRRLAAVVKKCRAVSQEDSIVSQKRKGQVRRARSSTDKVLTSD
jgi:hypothetical protein